MSHGFITYRANGTVMMDGFTKGGVLIDVLKCPSGTSGSKGYPRARHASMHYLIARQGSHTFTTADRAAAGGGIEAAITWTSVTNAPQGDTVIYVFARALVNVDTYGMLVLNDQGEILADPGFPSPQYVQTLQLNQQASVKYVTSDGYTAHVHTAVINTSQASDKLVLMALPDSGTNDTWYHQRRDYVLANEGAVTIQIVIYTKAASYSLPSLHVYALNKPAQSSDTHGMRLFDATGNLTFDSGVECLNLRDQLQVTMPAYGATSTHNLPVSNLPGVLAPFFYKSARTNTGDGIYRIDFYASAVRKVGSQLTIATLHDYRLFTGDSLPRDYEIGGTLMRYLPVADVAHQGAITQTGVPASSTSTPPEVTLGNSNAYANPGASYTFNVGVQGSPIPSLQWYRNGVAVPGQTSSSYTLTASSETHGSTVYCVGTNFMGSSQSRVATFYMDSFSPPVIAGLGPSAQFTTVPVGTVIQLWISASGNPTPNVSIQHGGTVLASGVGYCFYNYVVPVTSDYVRFDYRADGTGQYVGQGQTDQRFISSVEKPLAPVFSTQPSSITTTQNGSAVFSAAASDTSYYEWYRNDSYVGQGSSHSADTSTVGSFTYYCFAIGSGVRTRSSSVTLTVNAPTSAGFSNHNNVSGSGSGSGNLLMAVHSNGTASINGISIGTWGWGGSGSGSGYDVIGSASFSPASGSYGLSTRYSLSSGGVGWYTPSTPGTYNLNATVYMGNTPVALVQFSVTIS